MQGLLDSAACPKCGHYHASWDNEDGTSVILYSPDDDGFPDEITEEQSAEILRHETPIIHSDLVTALDADDILMAQWVAGKLVVVKPSPELQAKFAAAVAATDEQS